MKQGIFKITENTRLTKDVFKMKLSGDVSDIKRPGQFINIKIGGFFLRRPISVFDCSDDTVTVIYKTVGGGTEAMSKMSAGTELDILTGLGNGFNTEACKKSAVRIGGGVGNPPLYLLAKRLIGEGKSVTVIMGFNTESEIFAADEFESLGVKVVVTTADGSFGVRGFVTDALCELSDYDFYYACGPLPMLKAVHTAAKSPGELSFEERMGCGFGACMGCSCKTKYGYKRICKDGPVLKSEEVIL